MSKFEVGQRVQVVLDNRGWNGRYGTIHSQGVEGDFYDWYVLLDNGPVVGFQPRALDTAQNAPRGGTAAADDANTFQRAVRAMGRDDELAVALYQAHTFEGVAHDMTQERDALQAELAAARGLIDLIERLLPANRDHVGNTHHQAAHAWNASIAMDKIQAYKKQVQQPGRESVYAVGQEVILLDGTSLIGQVIEKGYKVSLDGDEGRWYTADELAAYNAGKAQDAASE